MNTDPQPATKPTTYRSDGPLGSLLNHIPMQSRFAVTVGIVVGVIASIIAGGLDEIAGKVALGIGIGVGIIAAITLAMHSSANRTH